MDKLVKVGAIQNLIFELRGQKVILDRDIAEIYGVNARRMRESDKRNIKRFPEDFMFQLNKYEVDKVVTQIASPSKSRMGGSRPYVFTRNGVNMLSTVLRSERAIMRSIMIMRAFSALEEAMSRRKRPVLQSPDIVKELSIHSKAIMRLFQEVKIKGKKIDRIEDIQRKITNLLQQMIIASIE